MAFVIDPKPQKSALTEKTCKHCGCLFAFVRNDIYTEVEYSYCDKDSYSAVKCPQCNKPNKAY